MNKSAKVRMLLRRNPNTKAGAVVETLDCTMQQAYVMLNTQRKAMGIYKSADGTFKNPPSNGTLNKNSILAQGVSLGRAIQRGMDDGSLQKRADENFVPFTGEITMEEPPTTNPDPVNHPYHYKVGGIETIDFIEGKNLGYNLGNAVKYISRADHKGNRLQDLQKAQWYLNREINKAQA